jgi:NAD(P)H dehydrogenase (quinone)
MTVAIAGASGHLGQAAAEYLLDRLAPAEIALVTRDPARLERFAERGVSVRRGDFDDVTSLDTAFAGVERLLLISTDALGRRVAQHTSAIQAAVRAGVRHVGYTSIGNPIDANPAGVVSEHKPTEDALAASGLDWTYLRNALYTDYRVPGLQQAIATGRLVHNYGDGRSAWVARDDCAAVAAAFLAGDAEPGRAYDVTGPELLSGNDLAAIAAEVGGVSVEAVDVDDATFVAGHVEQGLPEAYAILLASFGRAIREGHLAQLSTVVPDLAGRPARSVRDLLTAAVPATASAG